MQKVLLCLIGLGLFKGQVNGQRSSELSCYECAAKSSNDTCTDEYRKTVKVTGFDSRCRIMEMNGKVYLPLNVTTSSSNAKLCALLCELVLELLCPWLGPWQVAGAVVASSSLPGSGTSRSED